MTSDASGHIASFVVQTLPAQLEAVRAALLTYPGVTVEAWEPTGKIVIVLEASDAATLGRYADDIQRLPGVLVLGFVSHYNQKEMSS